MNADRVLIVGDSELADKKLVLRNMADKTQQNIPVDTVVETIVEAMHRS